VRVGFLGMAEEEWSIANDNQPGAAPVDPIAFVRAVKAHRADFDFLIVFLHAGAEGYPYPSPQLQNLCRFLIEEGASLVLCQHSHCLGAFEQYQQGFILYGQGNLLFDYPSQGLAAHEGAWVELTLEPGQIPEVELHYFAQSVGGGGLSQLDPMRLDELTKAVQARSQEVLDRERVRQHWEAFCQERAFEILAGSLGHSSQWRRFTRRLKVLSWLYPRAALLTAWNIVRCPTHREMLLTAYSQWSVARRGQAQR
jgi:hypothetical protein